MAPAADADNRQRPTSPESSGDRDQDSGDEWLGGSVLRPGFRLVGHLVRPHPVPFAISIVGALVFAGGTVLSTVVLGNIIDELVVAGTTEDGPSTRTLLIGIVTVLVVAVGRAAGVVTRRYFAGMTSEQAQARVRGQLASSYLTRPLAWFQTSPTGQLLAHVDSDSRMLVEVLHPLPFSIGVVGMAVFAGISLVVVDPLIALVALLIFPIMTISNRWYSTIVEKPMALSQERLGDVAGIAHESFEGALVVKTLGRSAAEVSRFSAAAEQLRAARVHAGVLRAIMHVSIAAWPAFGTLVVVLIGGFRVRSGDMTAGDIVQVAALFTLLGVPMAVFGFFLESLAPSLVANRRIIRATGIGRSENNDQHPVLTRTSSPEPAHLGARIEATRLTYAFARPETASGETRDEETAGEEPAGGETAGRDASTNPPDLAVDDVSLVVEPGETVAIVGATGSGKSTLVALLAGLLTPATGQVLIDGQNVQSLTPPERARTVSMVFQEPFLLAESVRTNIAMGAELGEEDVIRAAQAAEAWDFISAMPEGLDTVLGERGLTVSGGQRQRLGLARAFAQRAPLVILDDATSAVDTVTEQRILASLRSVSSAAGQNTGWAPTLVIVAHRLATIALADRVIWIREGAIAGQGTHADLMKNPNYDALVSAYEQADA